MTNDEIIKLLIEAEREWTEGSEKEAYFQNRLAFAYTLLNIAKDVSQIRQHLSVLENDAILVDRV